MNIFCIIPAFNEAANIGSVLDDLLGKSVKIVIVDDGSADNTFDIARKHGVTVLRHVINRGQGAALRTGTEYAISKDADIILHFDADGQFQVDDIPRMVEPIISGCADMVFGSRFLSGADNSEMPWSKKTMIMPLARFINKFFFGIKLTDPQSGFRAMNSLAARSIVWKQDKMAHCSEIIYLAHKAGIRIKEVPINVAYREYGQNWRGGLSIIKDMVLGTLLSK